MMQMYTISWLGTNFDCVNDGNLACWLDAQADPDTDYTTPMLTLGQTYYWRIEEVDTDPPCRVTHGQTWSFTVTDHIVVDDMESYNDTNNPIWDTWTDGCGGPNGYFPRNVTGSRIFPETGTVHSGAQSMQYFYDNCDFGYGGCWCRFCYSEIMRIYSTSQDWTAHGPKALTLHFYGSPDNDANDTEQMYVGLEDSSGSDSYVEVKYGDYGEDMSDIKIAEWQEWNIDLQDFNEGGVDLDCVKNIYIGFGERRYVGPCGGTGVVYFDDIRLYTTRCVPRYGPAADLSGNCIVDLPDIKIIADQWLHTDNITADLYPDNIVNLKDYAVPADSWFEQQLWPAP